MYLFVHTKQSRKAGPFSVARLKLDLPFNNLLALKEKCQPSTVSPLRASREGGGRSYSAAYWPHIASMVLQPPPSAFPPQASAVRSVSCSAAATQSKGTFT